MRCPFRMKGFDQPDTCDSECAWRMTYEPAPGGLDISPTSSCAVAILAQEANGSYGVRFEGEDNDEVGANDVVAAGEFDALDEYAQTLERENEELRKLCGANDALAAENGVSEASVDANDVNAMQDSREKLLEDLQKMTIDWHDYDGNFMRIYNNVAYAQIKELLDRQEAITEAGQREWWGGVVAELQEKVDKLTTELTAARRAHAQAEHDAETYREKLGRVLDMVQEMERVGTLVDQEGNVIG